MPLPRRLLVPLFFCTALAHAAPDTTDWHAAAQQDMRFAIDSVRSRHAGAVNGQVDVIAALDDGGRAGLVEAANVKTEQDYRRALVRFIDGFGDPHTGINLGLKISGWTGVVLDRVDGEYRVIWSEPNWPQPLPPRGARVQSCDGVWVGTYLKGSVAPFLNHSPEYPTSASEAARQSMFDLGLGWTPKQCTFTLADGANRSYDLPLRAVADGIGDERIKAVRASYVAKGRPVGLSPLAAGMTWVAMPDFDGVASGKAYDKLYAQLAAAHPAGWVVFDLRGNGGGDSSLGNRALQALYGKPYGEQLGDTVAYSALLIADQATIDLYGRYLSQAEFADAKTEFAHRLAKLQAAMRAGEKMAQTDNRTLDQVRALAAQVRKRPGGPRIAAVIDRRCFSSCMNFVLQITAMADTVLLGEPTLGYSPYGEINTFDLPSGHGSIRLPSAIFPSFHATREPFVPDVSYPGNIADETALRPWVAATLARIKPGQKPER